MTFAGSPVFLSLPMRNLEDVLEVIDHTFKFMIFGIKILVSEVHSWSLQLLLH